MKKLVLFLFLMMLASCNENFRYDEDDSVVSGTVTTIWSNLGISSAHAQVQIPAEILDEASANYLIGDFFTNVSGSDYSALVTTSLSDVNTFVASVGSLVSSNADEYTDADFVHGMGISLGYSSSKKLVSVLLSPVTAAGGYYFKDPASRLVSFYKMAFILSSVGGYKYRQSYVFKNGRPVKEDVDYARSAASIKITEELVNDSTQSISALKTKLVTFQSEVRSNLYQSEEESAVAMYFNNYYGGYSGLDPIQKTILESTVLHALRADAALRSAMVNLQDEFLDYLMVARPATLQNFGTLYELEDGMLIYNAVVAITEQLVSAGSIPSDAVIPI